MKNNSTLLIIGFFPLILLLFTQKISYSQIISLPDGEKISWDGSYYDYKDSAGVQMIKLWVPPNISPVRGIFISGHGGGSGDSRNFARDENIRAFAMRLGFAVAGLHNFPGRSAYDKGAKVFFQALDEFAKLGHHPELSNVPFVMYGSSNGGASTYGFVNYAPDRAICFVANVSSGGSPEIPVDQALKVPGVFIMGMFDALIGERGIERTKGLVSAARERGALWSWAIELKGHEDGSSFDLYMKMVEQCVALRYPENANPKNGKIALKEVKEESGWLADLESWDSGITKIYPFVDYPGNKKTAGWLPNQDLAYVYRSLATYHNPLNLSVKEFDRTFNPHIQPGTMFSLGGPVAQPGEKISVQFDISGILEWKSITLYNGAEKLGEISTPKTPEIIVQLDPLKQVYCLTALVKTLSGEERTCNPMHFFIQDPRLPWTTDKKPMVYTGKKINAGSKNTGKNISGSAANPADSILVAYGLTAEMEKQFSSTDKKISPFWDNIGKEQDYILLVPRQNAPADANFNSVRSHDCTMKVKAAYGADGIYLLYEITDDNDVAWPNSFAGTEDEQFYLNYDALDVLMDSRSLKEICDPAATGMMVSRYYGLTNTSKQYQIACGTEKERPLGFRRSIPDPFDFHASYLSFADAKKQTGMEIENIKTDYFVKMQEWFIPWSEYGGGLSGEPDPLTRLGFSPGYNDRDEGEHFPPGVTSSGGSVKASNALRWIGKTNPWGVSKPPFAWGEIELGCMLP